MSLSKLPSASVLPAASAAPAAPSRYAGRSRLDELADSGIQPALDNFRKSYEAVLRREQVSIAGAAVRKV